MDIDRAALESFLTYVTLNAQTIIQWLFLVVLALSGILIARGLFGRSEESVPATKSSSTSTSTVVAGPSPEMQELLNRILEQTSKIDEMASKPPSPEAVLQVEGELQELRKALELKEEEIRTLKESGAGGGEGGGAAASGGGVPEGQIKELNARIKELEAKLSEYEILEDDIADLSLYKDENARLKAELERLRKGGASAAAPTPEAAESSQAKVEVPPVPDSEDIVAEFAQAIGQSSPAKESTEASEAEQLSQLIKEVEAETQSAESAASEEANEPLFTLKPEQPVEESQPVEIVAQEEIPKPDPVAEEAPAPEPEPVVVETATPPAEEPSITESVVEAAMGSEAAAAPVGESPEDIAAGLAAAAAETSLESSPESGEADDLFAEFTKEGEQPPAEEEPLDPEKIMAEMASLIQLEPADGLDDSLDPGKLSAGSKS